MSGPRYSADNLDEVSAHFRRLAASFRQHADAAKTEKRRLQLSASASAWQQAAEFLDGFVLHGYDNAM